MLMEKERMEIAEAGRKLLALGLTRGTGGNLSIFDLKEKLFALSPSGMDYTTITPADVVVLNLKDEVVEGERKPSTEYALHRILYESRPDIHAVLHVHAVYTSALACMRQPILPLHYLAAYGGGANVPCAEYATFGTVALAENARKAMEGRKAVLLANHGLLTGAATLTEALSIADELEFCARLQCITNAMGGGVLLDEQEMMKNVEKFHDYCNPENYKK